MLCCSVALRTLLGDVQPPTKPSTPAFAANPQLLRQVITLVDLAGHEKYFRTTAYGLTGGFEGMRGWDFLARL